MADSALHLVPDPTSLAQAIIDTVRNPLLVLDAELKVVAASRSYYAMFGAGEAETAGRSLYDLATGQWDVMDLRGLMDTVLATDATIEAYEIEITLPGIGARTLLMDARRVFYAKAQQTSLLLGFEDVTLLRAATREKDKALLQQTLLVQEMHHRVANSLQIIASILMLKARAVDSGETRDHLKDAHRRVMSVAAVQSHLQASTVGEEIEIAPYLKTLADGLAASMIHDQRPVALAVTAGPGTTSSAQAISLGLIVTELVINAVKYAFVDNQVGRIDVAYARYGDSWRLSVDDDGRGLTNHTPKTSGGLGSSLISALATQLGARVERRDLEPGLSVAVIHEGAPPSANDAQALQIAD